MFDTVMIANRGEIACRIIDTCASLGIRSVAVFSDIDAGAPHVQRADTAVRIGPAPAAESYLNIETILDAAARTRAQAIHPGYGFLAENADFARRCAVAGIVFVGPTPEAIETMGDKIAARAAVESRGVPTVPGLARPGLSDDDLIAGADDVGYPILIKPSAGGGGKGMHRVDQPADLPDLLARARREARTGFGDDTLFIERFITNPRHIEVQILADTHGHVIHLGERECSLQRRHQKIVEEAPSPLLTPEQRHSIGQAAIETARSVAYVGAGTVEFIVSADRPGEPFFMEMNTRLQVEHPVTEMVTGIDLVEQQLRVAAGEPLAISQADVTLDGHAIEARIYAEDPAAGFLPTGGTIQATTTPEDVHVRVDGAVWPGTEVSSHYDPMLAKIIAHGPDRATALERLQGALRHTGIVGVRTNLGFLANLLDHPRVRAGDLDTSLVDAETEQLARRNIPNDVYLIAALALWQRQRMGSQPGASWQPRDSAAQRSPWRQPSGWRIGAQRPITWRFERDGAEPAVVCITGAPEAAQIQLDDSPPHSAALSADGGSIRLDGIERSDVWVDVTDDEPVAWLQSDGQWVLPLHRPARGTIDGVTTPSVEAPMPGQVVSLAVTSGEVVAAGDAIASVEAMKMEHQVRAGIAGVVEVLVAVGEQVTRGQILAQVRPELSS